MEADALKSVGPPCSAACAPQAQPPVAYLVVIRKGPTWGLPDIEPYCRMLSRRFEGEVWAFGSYEADTVIGRMRLRVASLWSARGGSPSVLNFVRRALGWIKELRRTRPFKLAFLAVDPFTSGMLALYAARRAGGVSLCEVNGVYSSRHHTADNRSPGLRWLRMTFRRLVGAFVLHRVTAVRILFADQLEGFARLPKRALVRQIFETTHLEIFHPGPEEPIILGVGHPFRVKGFDVLCRAFTQIADRHPQWRLVLIGYQVPEDARRDGLEHPHIEVYPGLPQRAVAEWMARCAIFALPSRTEAMGRVLLEAGSAAKCRVASRVDGIPTVIEDGVDGLLVEPESVEELAAVLERAMDHETLRKRLGEEARRRVEREFSADAYVDRYSDLVAAALTRGRA